MYLEYNVNVCLDSWIDGVGSSDHEFRTNRYHD